MKFFSIFSGKKKNNGEDSEMPKVYLETFARRTGAVKYCVLFLLIVFLAFGFTFFSENLTIDNFRYMLKFMSIDMDAVIDDGSMITFDTGGEPHAMILNGDLAIADGNGVQVFDMSGERFLKESVLFDEILCGTNGNYLIAGEMGGSKLYHYSVYARIATQDFDYPVYGLSTVQSGHYGVLTAAQGYRSGIEVYDGENRIVFNYYFADRYASSIAVSQNGKNAACTVISNTQSGEFLTQLYIFDTADPDNVKCIDFVDEMPYGAFYRKDGKLAVITDKALRFFASGGQLSGEAYFSYGGIKGFFFSDSYIAVTFNSEGLSNGSNAVFYDENGEIEGSILYTNDISSINIIGEYAYIYSIGNVNTVHIPFSKSIRSLEAGNDFKCVLLDEANNRLIFVYTGKAVFYDQANYINNITNTQFQEETK